MSCLWIFVRKSGLALLLGLTVAALTFTFTTSRYMTVANKDVLHEYIANTLNIILMTAGTVAIFVLLLWKYVHSRNTSNTNTTNVHGRCSFCPKLPKLHCSRTRHNVLAISESLAAVLFFLGALVVNVYDIIHESECFHAWKYCNTSCGMNHRSRLFERLFLIIFTFSGLLFCLCFDIKKRERTVWVMIAFGVIQVANFSVWIDSVAEESDFSTADYYSNGKNDCVCLFDIVLAHNDSFNSSTYQNCYKPYHKPWEPIFTLPFSVEFILLAIKILFDYIVMADHSEKADEQLTVGVDGSYPALSTSEELQAGIEIIGTNTDETIGSDSVINNSTIQADVLHHVSLESESVSGFETYNNAASEEEHLISTSNHTIGHINSMTNGITSEPRPQMQQESVASSQTSQIQQQTTHVSVTRSIFKCFASIAFTLLVLMHLIFITFGLTFDIIMSFIVAQIQNTEQFIQNIEQFIYIIDNYIPYFLVGRIIYRVIMMCLCVVGFILGHQLASRTHRPRQLERFEYFVILCIVGPLTETFFIIICAVDFDGSNSMYKMFSGLLLSILQEIVQTSFYIFAARLHLRDDSPNKLFVFKLILANFAVSNLASWVEGSIAESKINGSQSLCEHYYTLWPVIGNILKPIVLSYQLNFMFLFIALCISKDNNNDDGNAPVPSQSCCCCLTHVTGASEVDDIVREIE